MDNDFLERLRKVAEYRINNNGILAYDSNTLEKRIRFVKSKLNNYQLILIEKGINPDEILDDSPSNIVNRLFSKEKKCPSWWKEVPENKKEKENAELQPLTPKEHSKVKNEIHRYQKYSLELSNIEENLCEKQFRMKKSDRLADRVILNAIQYVGSGYSYEDDFVRRIKKSSRISLRKSHPVLVNSIIISYKKRLYRETFNKIISWMKLVESEIILEKYRLSDIVYGTHVKYLTTSCLYYSPSKDDDRAILSSMFFFGSATDQRKLAEVFCQLLIELGNLNDAVEVTSEYPQFINSIFLAEKIKDALSVNKSTVAKSLLDVLITSEEKHPDSSKFKSELTRLKKIELLQSTNGFDISSIDKMAGNEFEKLLALKFQKLGFAVEMTPPTGDFGADLIITTPNDSKISIQCKRFKNKVNLKAVQEVVASLTHYQCDYGIVITNNDYLKSAKKLAENNEVELWDKYHLIDFLAGDIHFSILKEL